MAEMEAIQRYLRSFALYVRKEAKANLKNAGKGGDLEKSIKFRVTKNTEGYQVEFRMLNYGQFVDKGVSGNKKIQQYTTWDGRKVESPFKFTNLQPPPNILAKWIKKKKIKGRDKKSGRYITTLSLAYIIGRSIKRDGLKSLSFFQKPLGVGMDSFGLGMMGALKEDIIKGWTQFKQG
jgi:hypothetical protein